ncbi:ABC transporter permease subunit [Schlesneria sp. DSM 10557]|uniref:ABC transporter permease subunit n=1 Tax=Schlesneria sp. DSM 10557 TaxID=3044399 RepID=UPI0035A02D3D
MKFDTSLIGADGVSILERVSLPLLTKELIEQSQNKRTYLLRVVYAVILYGIALWQYQSFTQGGGTASLMNMGQGRGLSAQLMMIQQLAILILVPAIACGAVTVEKEKDTLALLLLTRLSPLTIVFEKLLSRVVAMGTYQLLSLPLFAIIYGIGGVEISVLIFSVVRLVGMTFVVGSISVLCSSWFRTTSTAFIMSYVMVAFYWGAQSAVFQITSEVLMSVVGIFRSMPLFWLAVITGAVIDGLLSLLLLRAAARVLVSRAFVPPRNMVLEWFRRADRFFNDLNSRTTGGVILVKDDQSLPLFHPISWRETQKKSLGTFRYQFRVLMLLLTPLILVIASMLMDGRGDFTNPFRGFPAFFWTVSIICLTIHASGAIASERIRQSLDVLLVAPISASEIVFEKLSGVQRMVKILTVPFAVSILFQAIWTGYVMQDGVRTHGSNFWREITSATLGTLIYMQLLVWTSFYLGLRFKTQMQAVLATLILVVSVCLIPIVVTRFAYFNFGQNLPFLGWLSPLQMVFPTLDFSPDWSRAHSDPGFAWITLGLHFVLFSLLWWWMRWISLSQFSRILGRSEGPVHGSSPNYNRGPELSTWPSSAEG